MQLMNKNLWGIVKGIEATPANPNKLIEWESRDDKEKAIIGLAFSDSELHRVDLDKSSKEIWENLNKLCEACYCANCRLGKADPIHKMAITVGEFTHCHLR
jgi:hypothetical protein